MNRITVKASNTYDVIIGKNLLADAGRLIANIINPGKAAIISDSNVFPLFGNQIVYSLQSVGFEVSNFVFAAGEQSKTGNTYLQILNFLAENQITRTDVVIALGGGVVGDITGFAASSYLRGVKYIQIPTTLLAMVDSSVGGKTAIDLSVGKNLAGAFYQPALVICDICALDTLPSFIFRDGCAEVIKYAILYDAELFAHLLERGIAFDRETVISRCITLKRDVVSVDEFDRGDRQRLNLGHTIGHGVEASSNYAVSHGQAVSIGIAIVSRAAVKYNICSNETRDSIIKILTKFTLPINTDLSAQRLYNYALADKKRTAGFVNLIIPERIGYCAIQKTPIDQLISFIEAGL